ncbi:CHAD domain-containing protein [Pontibacter sp. G13]|uniref:CHAD domain-containing protein n=1 Tax=Pontibacter sp. G13 TaxID=3074898 RepID=UPI0028891B44|nr:CHAD domain-containing protein [Pontibacter sp. G13]WNJ19400.1 CHAD domain-containing protein [Pontibacter sp. G13]
MQKHWQTLHKKRLKQTEQHLHEANQTQDPEAIHAFRVSVKKLRALYQMWGHVLEGPPIDEALLLPIDSLYRLSGKVRDVQILQGLNRQVAQFHLSPIPEWDVYLQHREKVAQKRLTKALKAEIWFPRKDISSAFNQQVSQISKRQLKGQLRRYLSQRVNALADEIISAPKHRRMHDLRKRVKSLMYGLNMADKTLPEIRQTYHHKALAYSAQTLGIWHDWYVWKDRFVKFSAKQTNISSSRLQEWHVFGLNQTHSLAEVSNLQLVEWQRALGI